MVENISRSLILFSVFMPIILIMISKSTSAPTYIYSSCSNATMFANNSQYEANLNTVFRYLSSNSTNPNGFHQAISSNANNTSDTIYGHFLCRGDLNVRSCQDCVTTATSSDLPRTYCPNRKEAIIWYDECFIRYSNHSFINTMDDQPSRVLLSTRNIGASSKISDSLFRMLLNNMLNDLANQAAKGSDKKFAVAHKTYKSFTTMYGLGQCTPDLSLSDCILCLDQNGISPFSQTIGGRILTPSCVFRYETYPFFDTAYLSTRLPSPSPSPLSLPSTSHSKKRRTILLVALSTSALVPILLLYGVWTCMRKKAIQTSSLEVSEIEKAALDSLQFDLNTIRAATNNFSTDNKLGEGGFGEVYKGVLENGQKIAVKRLSKNSGQGDVEFKTEVFLVAKLRHKNLVKLLGFCVAFDEKILVYEFLPKSSLDRLLFDPTRQASLDWQTRFNIIVGIARGLLYLHEDSPLKIIHRDLKSSNILLDENLNPKIADFGLAKLFGVDQTQGDTRRIVGTYGYMAPEYAITGHFSVKSDVYSFGVLILEIVSGQRSRFFGRLQLEEALLHCAWRLWNEDKILDLMDTTLSNNFPREEVTKCIHIGLLCIQEDAVARPRMTSIISALNGQAYNLPVPKPPNFFGTTNNEEDNNEMQHDSEGVYTGTKTITELYPRD